MPNPDELPNTHCITTFIHCGQCIDEFQAKPHPGESIQTFTRYEMGYTKQGIQIWCLRHKCNIMHVDFEGKQHPANITRHLEPGT